MAVREYGTRSIRWRLGGAEWGPFDGGANARDLPTAIAANELDGTVLTGTKNLTLDERGVAIKRNDCPGSTSFPAPPGQPIAFFYSNALSLGIIQFGTGLYKCAIGGGSWTLFDTRGSAAVNAFTDFAGVLVYVNTGDGVTKYDGTTVTHVGLVNGSCIAAWQNKLWVGGNTTNRTRLFIGDAGVVNFVPGTNFVDLKEKDDKPLTALYPTSGLLVFKEDSAYRVNDSTTGSYQTIDWEAGCVGARAIEGQDGRVVTWGLDGLYETTGVSSLVNVGDKMRPRFLSSNLNATTKALISAVSVNGRVYFAYPQSSSSVTDAILEYNPRVGWLMDLTVASVTTQVGPFAYYPAASGGFTSSFVLGSEIRDLFTAPPSFFGSSTCTLLTGWVEPFGGSIARLSRLSLLGSGAVSSHIQFFVRAMNRDGVETTYTGTTVLPFQAPAPSLVSVRPLLTGSAFSVQVTDSPPADALSIQSIQADFTLSSLG